jgi:hypothetical protein
VCSNYYQLAWNGNKIINSPQTGGELWEYNSSSLPTVVISYPAGEAANKLLLKIKDQKINIAQAAAESPMTVHMIGDSVRRIANAFLQLKKFNVVGAVNTLRMNVSHSDYRKLVKLGRTQRAKGVSGPQFASNTWLELQYGWKPLLSDIYGACEQLADALHSGDRVFFETSATAMNRYTMDVVWNPSISGAISSGRAKGFAHCRSTYKVRYRVNSNLSTLSQLGVTNPLLLGWELLPYSFVVDWALPIGNYLSTLDATVGYSFVSGSYTQGLKGTNIYTTTFRGTRDSAGTAHYGTLWFERVRDGKDRLVLSQFPSPSFPRPKSPFSSSHVTSALALLQQAFGRTPGRL